MSPEAKSLVSGIIDIILGAEQRKRARQTSTAVAFKSAVGLIVGDLLIGLQTREVGWSYFSLSTATFSDRPIGYWTFKRTIQAMEAVGLLDVSLGRKSQAIDFGGGQKPVHSPNFATRFRPTATMAAMALDAGIGDESATQHFPPQLPKKVIEVRAKSEKMIRRKDDGVLEFFGVKDIAPITTYELRDYRSVLDDNRDRELSPSSKTRYLTIIAKSFKIAY